MVILQIHANRGRSKKIMINVWVHIESIENHEIKSK